MKFVQVDKAQGLELGKEVFTVNEAGEYGLGKLIERTEDLKNGKMHKFEMATFFDDVSDKMNTALQNLIDVEQWEDEAKKDDERYKLLVNATGIVSEYKKMLAKRGSLIVSNVVQVAIPTKVVKVNEHSESDSGESQDGKS
jgi:hypothetical protein